MSTIVRPLLRVFDYAGRSRRLELWPFAILAVMLVIDAALLDATLGRDRAVAGIAGPIGATAAVLLAPPLVPLLVRRLHDGGRSGGWIALLAMPVVGWAWLVMLLAAEGAAGANRFGPDPKEAERRPQSAGLFAR